jgi:hypothetical protein
MLGVWQVKVHADWQKFQHEVGAKEFRAHGQEALCWKT